MTSRSLFALLLLLFGAVSAAGQDWAKKMFKTTHHNFGVVARGSKSEFAFELTNMYVEDAHIASVRSTCGCTTPKITQPILKTWEKGAILAVYNTTTYLGHRTSTITVTFDQPFFAEVQLTSEGFIRGDVVFDPGEVNFGELELGSGGERKVRVAYAGRSDWKIVDVRSANTNFEVEPGEVKRIANRVEYDMVVRLKPEAPAGYFRDQLTFVTDDEQMKTIPLAVAGRVLSPVTVSPASLVLGKLRPGETVTKNLVVRGKRPFRVTNVKCANGGFEFQTSDAEKTLHLIPVKFTAGDKPGKIVEKIELSTDFGVAAELQCVATATIVKEASGD